MGLCHRSESSVNIKMLYWSDLLSLAKTGNPDPGRKVIKTDAEWRRQLSPEELSRHSPGWLPSVPSVRRCVGCLNRASIPACAAKPFLGGIRVRHGLALIHAAGGSQIQLHSVLDQPIPTRDTGGQSATAGGRMAEALAVNVRGSRWITFKESP
jgi:hypothetical protein